MYGAIIGDIVGSIYEFNNVKTKDFEFITERNHYTDDTVMTVAVASAMIKAHENKGFFADIVGKELRDFGRRYPDAGYGGMFRKWLEAESPEPYNSFGNGSAMRVSALGVYAPIHQEAGGLAEQSAKPTHNHPEGVKGAVATAKAVFWAKSGKSKEEIRELMERVYGYDLSFSLDDIRDNYSFDVTCQGSVPQAIVAFLESTSYEDAIRNAVSIGGDSDTLAAITGGIAWSYYGKGKGARGPIVRCPDGFERPKELADILAKYDIDSFLPDEFVSIIRRLEECRQERLGIAFLLYNARKNDLEWRGSASDYRDERSVL